MNQSPQAFEPTELWLPDNVHFTYEPEITEAFRVMNSKNPQELIDSLTPRVRSTETGVVYAVLDGDNPEEYSKTDGLVLLSPFANTLMPHNLVGAELIREVAKAANVRDEEGKLKPVIIVSSPGVNGSVLNLSPGDIEMIRSGELGPVSRELLTAVSAVGVGRISLFGFSQAADLTLAGARKEFSPDFDIDGVAAGDVSGNTKRGKTELGGIARIGLDFTKSGSLNDAIEFSGLDAQRVAFGLGAGVKGMITNFLPSVFTSPNGVIMSGLAKDSFEARMQEIITEGMIERLVVAYGGEQDAISPPKNIEPAMARLYERYGRSAFISIRAEGMRHNWGDMLPLLSKLYLRAMR
jgi:hypothetical protein